MGANEKTSLSAMCILVMLIVFNTNHVRATISLPVQINLKNNSTTYHCNGSVDECLIMDGIDSEFLMDSIDTSRMLAGANPYKSLVRNAADIRARAVVDCGRGKSSRGCLPGKNCRGVYDRICKS